MRQPEAKALVATLVAAFRPRDWGEASTSLYTAAIMGFAFADAQGAVHALIRHTDYMPSVHGLVEEIIEQRSLGRELPAPSWTAEDEAEARRITEEFYSKHRFIPPKITGPAGPQPIAVDEAEVAAKRKVAATAARTLRRQQKAAKDDAEREVADEGQDASA